ncbi:MAG: hypothetical protein JWM11_6840 [Planctomycetaceae bacterium]|nr:hypothetical protein [Planctomycetaceae bacterium]
MMAAYSGCMRNLDQSPYESACPGLFAKYSATSDVGRNLRSGDAELRLREMSDAETKIREQELLHAQVSDRLERFCKEHELNMQYLIQFGVLACERELFRHVLLDVVGHGGLSLSEAADLAHARYVAAQPTESANS